MIARIDQHLARLQAGWTAVGVGAYMVTLLVIRRSRDLDRYRYLLLLAAVALMLAPLVPHLGRSINGARLWVYIGPINGQPVELAKLALCIFFASYFTERRELLSVPTYRIGDRLVLDPRPLGPDPRGLGLRHARARGRARHRLRPAHLRAVHRHAVAGHRAAVLWLALGLVLFVVGAFVSSRLFSQVHQRVDRLAPPLAARQRQRIPTRPGPLRHGLGRADRDRTRVRLPAPAVPHVPVPVLATTSSPPSATEMGLLGTSLIVFAFVLLVGNGLRIAQQARSEFAKLAAAGLTLIIGMQAFFIMAGIVRLLPLTGHHPAVHGLRRLVAGRQLRPHRAADADLRRGWASGGGQPGHGHASGLTSALASGCHDPSSGRQQHSGDRAIASLAAASSNTHSPTSNGVGIRWRRTRAMASEGRHGTHLPPARAGGVELGEEEPALAGRDPGRLDLHAVALEDLGEQARG